MVLVRNEVSNMTSSIQKAYITSVIHFGFCLLFLLEKKISIKFVKTSNCVYDRYFL